MSRTLGARGSAAAAERSDGSPGSARVTYVIGTYPLLTTTFIDREILLLRSWSLDVDVISLRPPRPGLSPEQLALVETTGYARPAAPLDLIRRNVRFLVRRPQRYLGTFARLVARHGQSLRQRARTAGHFVLGVHVAGMIAETGSTRRIHAHFIDRAATVAYVAARLLDVPYSVTAHASDIYIAPVLLDLKMEGADFVATCTRYNVDHLATTVPRASDRLVLNYHGLDLQRYAPATPAEEGVPTLVAVGQLRPKKGFVHLVEACHLLRLRGTDVRVEIIGAGPQQAELEQQIHKLGLDDVVTLRGALPHGEVIEAYERASAFVLPCVVGDDGDRDGIPNVILEAMAMQLPVVSTRHSGIPEAVEHGTTGLLVPPSDAAALATALEWVIDDPATARQMGRRGRRVITERFDLETNVRTMYDRFVGTEAMP